jgi:thioredoxin reductase (NADPH)
MTFCRRISIFELVEMVPNTTYDVIILGGGPAGITAALWCVDLGLKKILLIEQKAELGGQLCETYNPIENYPGVHAANGKELRDLFLRSLDRNSFETQLNMRVAGVDLRSRQVRLDDSTSMSCAALIVATGVRRRRLGIQGEMEFAGRGVMRSGAGEKEEVRGRHVLIIGGGDAAMENTLMLSEFAREVIVVHRGEKFSARDEFVNAVRGRDNVRFEFGTVAERICGRETVEGVILKPVGSGDKRKLETDYVLIRIGVEPNSDLFREDIEIDRQGYAIVDAACHTRVPGVFVAGDVANPTSPTIATAVGMGAAAAKAAHQFVTSCSK